MSASTDGENRKQFPSVAVFRRQVAAFDRHDFRLTERGEWRRAGTDGRDVGANLEMLATVR